VELVETKTKGKVVSQRCRPGLGLRSVHYPYLEKNRSTVAEWFEAISENYMDSYGRPREILHKIRNDYPLALHGVSLSLASAEGLNQKYLCRLKDLYNEFEPFLVSDHICWTGPRASNIHDLLPFPYTNEALECLANNIDHAQSFLQRSLLIENVSTYMTFKESEFNEWDFIVKLLKKTGSKLLLDINNVYVSATNHGFNAKTFLQSIPISLIGQIHLAGYSDMGDFLFDTHSKPVHPQVWQLFEEFVRRVPDIPFMIEWDDDIPEFPQLEAELQKAKNIWQKENCNKERCHESL